MNKDFIPFKCSSCNVEFAPEEGGQCHKCHRVFCTNHLFRLREGNRLILTCEECNGSGRGKKKRNYVLKIKEKFGKTKK